MKIQGLYQPCDIMKILKEVLWSIIVIDVVDDEFMDLIDVAYLIRIYPDY
jgi:hypothetical protein